MITHEDSSIAVHWGDCIELLRADENGYDYALGYGTRRLFPDNSVDSVCCDPPYGLEFMGKGWDAPWQERDVNADAGMSATGYTDGGNRLERPSFTGSTNPKCLDCKGTRRGRRDGTAKVAVCLCENGGRFPNVRAVEMRAFGEWCEQWVTECLRVLKPGGHLLAFGGTRTWHRLACAVEDAGFEVRDSIAWMYGSGFPKSLDVSKAIDKAAGAEREVIAPNQWAHKGEQNTAGATVLEAGADKSYVRVDITAPATDAARTWQGWGTALKPAFEPVVVARKPLAGTVAGNVLAHGTGALNVDGCRVEHDEPEGRPSTGMHGRRAGIMGETIERHRETTAASTAGRWPANVVLDESQAAALDQQSGDSASPTKPVRQGGTVCYDVGSDGAVRTGEGVGYGDQGGASRFFYTAKADATERPFIFRPTCECEDSWPTHTPSAVRATCETTEAGSSSTSSPGSATTAAQSPRATRSTTSTATSSTITPAISSQSPPPTTSASTQDANYGTANGGSPAASASSSSESAAPTGISALRDGRSTDDAAPATSRAWSATSVCARCGAPSRREAHATVKPLALMRWLVRLVTPPGGTVLEPFAGSGTTVEACILEGFRCIAIEREADYLPLIMQRINRRVDPVAAVAASGEDGGLFDLLGEATA